MKKFLLIFYSKKKRNPNLKESVTEISISYIFLIIPSLYKFSLFLN